MAEEPTPADEPTPTPEAGKEPEDQRVPYERFQQVNKQAREASDKAKAAEKRVASQNFIDPDDATRYVDLDNIEDTDAAERAVKQVAKKKQHLLKSEEPTLPGRVLQNGQTVAQDGKAKSNIDPNAEAAMLAEGLRQFASRS
jgi:hypothetical protein